jgi:hypothetical protein
MKYYITNTPGVREIASKWTIRLSIGPSVRGIASKWTIRLPIGPV